MGLSMALCSVHTQVGCRWKMTAPAMQMPVVAEGRRSRLVAVSNRTNYVPTVHSSISRAVSGLFFLPSRVWWHLRTDPLPINRRVDRVVFCGCASDCIESGCS